MFANSSNAVAVRLSTGVIERRSRQLVRPLRCQVKSAFNFCGELANPEGFSSSRQSLTSRRSLTDPQHSPGR